MYNTLLCCSLFTCAGKGFGMETYITAAMILCGTAVGAVQFLILKNITERILISGKNPIIPLLLKAAVYAVSAVLLLTVLRDRIAFAGIGFGAGIILSSFIYFACVHCRSSSSTGKKAE